MSDDQLVRLNSKFETEKLNSPKEIRLMMSLYDSTNNVWVNFILGDFIFFSLKILNLSSVFFSHPIRQLDRALHYALSHFLNVDICTF